MNPIFEYQDYRDYLMHYYEERKKSQPLFSYQMFGNILGLNPSGIFHVLEKKRHLPVRCAPKAKEILKLTGRAAEYFDLLLAASRTKKQRSLEELMQKAHLLRGIRQRELAKEELTYVRQWWTVVIRSFMEINQGRTDATAIAQSLIPQITEKQAQDSIALLKSLGFLRRVSSERVELVDAHLNVRGPEKAQAIREFQAQVMQVGARSLENIDPAKRDISTLTMTVDDECFNDIKQMIHEFRDRLQMRVDECTKPQRVMQLNLAFFPVTQDIAEMSI